MVERERGLFELENGLCMEETETWVMKQAEEGMGWKVKGLLKDTLQFQKRNCTKRNKNKKKKK